MGLSTALLTKNVQNVVGASASLSITANQTINGKIATNAGNSGTLTTRTTATSGTITTTASGVITTGQTIDIWWTNADGSIGLLANCVAGSVSGTDVPFTGTNSSGANLPVATTAVVVTPVVVQSFEFVGNNVLLAAAICQQFGPGAVSWMTSSTAVGYLTAFATNFIWDWAFGTSLSTNPFAGLTITQVQVSTMYLTSQTVSFGVLSN
jgi:hypothetical protein